MSDEQDLNQDAIKEFYDSVYYATADDACHVMNLASAELDSFTGLIMVIRDFDSRAYLLASQHSSGCIGRADGVARSALFLAGAGNSFPDGTVIGLDAGIGSRLHDPN